jgi:hypothetical protein
VNGGRESLFEARRQAASSTSPTVRGAHYRRGGTEITLPGLLSVPADQYHADQIDDTRPSLSASLACVLFAKSPAHAYVQHPRLNPDFAQPEAKKAWDLGTVAHSLLLEGYANVHVVEGVTDWRTKDAQAERDQARAEGKTPMLRHEFEEVSAMVDMAREELAAWTVDPPLLTDGKPEQTVTWDEDGVLCRCRPDWLRDDYTVVEDVKTTARGADPGYFSRKTVYEHGYDVKAAMYLRGVRKPSQVLTRSGAGSLSRRSRRSSSPSSNRPS